MLFAKYAMERIFLKSVALNQNNSVELQMEARQRLADLPRNSSPVRIKNRCKVTGRGRGVLSFFGLSRITFR